MTEKQCDQLIEYYNGHLTGLAKLAFEEHLKTCSECREELAEWNHLTESLAFEAVPVVPPAGMKERILKSVLTEENPEEINTTVMKTKSSRKKNYLLYSTAAALFISVIGNIVLLNHQGQVEQPPNTAGVDKVLNYVALHPVDGEAAGTASFIESGGKNLKIVIQATKLKQLKEDEVYQVWLIKGKKPYRAGTFVSSGTGNGAVVFPLDQLKGESWDAVAITLEPNAKSETPKGSMVLKSSL